MTLDFAAFAVSETTSMSDISPSAILRHRYCVIFCC